MLDKPVCLSAPSAAGSDPACAVIDTQVVLDWLVFRDPGVARLVTALESGRLRWIGCPPMRLELARMLGHHSLMRWQPDATAALAHFDRQCRLAPAVPAPQPMLRCRDSDDQVFIDLALGAGARWLFTRDKALLALAARARRRGTEIVTPARWAAIP
jgi:predicted nucleic acid-binding protein